MKIKSQGCLCFQEIFVSLVSSGNFFLEILSPWQMKHFAHLQVVHGT